MNENNDPSAFLKSDLINSIQDVQPLDQVLLSISLKVIYVHLFYNKYLTQNFSLHQLYNGGGDTSLVGNTSCVLNESPISVNQNSMQASFID
jgi:hypothetical protein